VLFYYACVKKNSYPTLPEIEYKDFFPYVGDSADLQVKFTDGDGDIGVSETILLEHFGLLIIIKIPLLINMLATIAHYLMIHLEQVILLNYLKTLTKASLLVAKSVLDFNNFDIAKK
jgi:hypothetical protein